MSNTKKKYKKKKKKLKQKPKKTPPMAVTAHFGAVTVSNGS